MFGLSRFKAWFRLPAQELDRFCTLVAASGLMTAGDIAGARKDFDAALPGAATDSLAIPAFCQFLTQRGTLTQWQAGKLKDGRYKGFFVANPHRYKILDFDRIDDDCSVYLVEDLDTNETLHMRVMPQGKMRSSPARFQIEERDKNWHDCW